MWEEKVRVAWVKMSGGRDDAGLIEKQNDTLLRCDEKVGGELGRSVGTDSREPREWQSAGGLVCPQHGKGWGRSKSSRSRGTRRRPFSTAWRPEFVTFTTTLDLELVRLDDGKTSADVLALFGGA